MDSLVKLIEKKGSKYGVKEAEFWQIWGSCERKGKIQLSIKFYLTNLIFQYISTSQVVKSGIRWYGFLKWRGKNDVSG